MRPVVLAICVVCAGLAGPVLALASAPAQPGSPVLVIGSAAVRDAAIADAGGRPIGPRTAPLAGLAMSDSPDFADRLRAAGAWAVADGAVLAHLCGAT